MNRKRLWFGLLALFGVGCAVYLWSRVSIAEDSPLARMYRTEADLAAIVTALEHYRERHGAYPPSGTTGLEAAAKALSEKVNFFPEGPPIDGWGRSYRYALDAGGGGYELYSLGADAAAAEDDIRPNAERVWREVYRSLQRDYVRGGAIDAH